MEEESARLQPLWSPQTVKLPLATRSPCFAKLLMGRRQERLLQPSAGELSWLEQYALLSGLSFMVWADCPRQIVSFLLFLRFPVCL